jgi:hypothetical protein
VVHNAKHGPLAAHGAATVSTLSKVVFIKKKTKQADEKNKAKIWALSPILS